MNFFYPGSSSGQTAKTGIGVSRRAGIDFTIYIIGKEDRENPGLFLGVGWEDTQKEKKDQPRQRNSDHIFCYLHVAFTPPGFFQK
jgi:hypothetical protein